jgi:hypothetical protein
MSRYKQFEDELSITGINEESILPELDVDEQDQLEFKPQLRTYPLNFTMHVNRFKSRAWQRRTTLERYLLLIICVFLILLLLILGRLWSGQKQRHHEPLCLTDSCIQAASAMSAAMNQSINPCDDFHDFACGRWIAMNVIPKGYSSWSTTQELIRKNNIVLKTILEQMVIDNSSSTFNAEYEVAKFYRSCMNKTEIERLETRPLDEFFLATFNFTVDQWIQMDQNRTWQEFFANSTRTLSMKLDASYLFPISIAPDEKNSSWNTIRVSFVSPRSHDDRSF